MRRAYLAGGLEEADMAADPLTQFGRWFADAVTAGLREPNAMVLATATRDGAPSARLVLLKEYDDTGLVFFTNYDSRKGAELAANPRAALLFPWHDLERQVRVEGGVERIPTAASEEYFVSRPRGSRLGAWASPQSDVIGSRAELATRLAEVTARFGPAEDDPAVPLPAYWGGYRLIPEVVEFWQGREDRLHDRLRYRRADAGWLLERLAP
ncbi:MAG: pyridoxamine 5'-phosphate oxidase [Frankiaceae bacterium]